MDNENQHKILVAYFSATGTTKRLAEMISKKFNFELFEIEPVDKYSENDLDWTNPLSRSSKEYNNKDIMPKIKNNIDIKEYNKIILCYPIWWYMAPNIINNFLKSNDFSNKEILLFATSGGSNFGKSIEYLKKYVDSSCVIKEGLVNPNFDDVKK